MINKLQLTMASQAGSRLTKQLMPDGSWDSAGTIYDAHAETKAIYLSELPTLIDSIQNHQALILGVSTDAPCRLITADAKKNGANGITRTKDNFSFSENPSLMLLDIDFKQSPNPDIDIVSALTQIANETFGYVIRGSTSSNIIKHDGTALEGSNGCHIYVVVQSGKNIPRILDVVNQLLILAGYGFVFISESGQAEVRTPVDVKVGSAERLIYESAPDLPDGYTQNRPCEYIAGGLFSVTTLNAADEQKIENIKAELLQQA